MSRLAWQACAALLALSASAFAQDEGKGDEKPGAAPPAPPAAPASPIDAAIENGLVWLCRHQDADGAWRVVSVPTHCDADTPCIKDALGDVHDAGVTGLAVLALLGTGASPAKPVVLHGAKADITYDAWACSQRGVAWLIAQQDKQGTVSAQKGMYSDCIAAIALCEAYRVNRDPACKRAAQRAIDFLEEAQANRPNSKTLWGWRYTPKDMVSDTSVTGWAVQAFESARGASIHVPMAAMSGAVDFINWVTGPTGGLVGYLDPAGAGAKVTGHNDSFDYHPGTMSAIAIAVRLRADKKPDKETAAWLKTAVDQVLLKDLPTAKTPLAVDYYYWHHGSEAWSLLGSHGFKKLADTGTAWQTALVDALLSLQSARSEKCSSGGWLTGDRWAYAGGPTYSTAINVLTLQGLKRP